MLRSFWIKMPENSWTIQTNACKYISNKFWYNTLTDIWLRQSRILCSDLFTIGLQELLNTDSLNLLLANSNLS